MFTFHNFTPYLSSSVNNITEYSMENFINRLVKAKPKKKHLNKVKYFCVAQTKHNIYTGCPKRLRTSLSFLSVNVP